MIILTKLDNSKILLNFEAIKYIESIPDTLIIFLNGDTVIVKESLEQIRQAILAFRAEALGRVKAATQPMA